MANELSVSTFEQIATVLSQLATNYSNLAGTFYDVFYNPTPLDVTFQMFDSSGVLRDYTVENLAKANVYKKAGNQYPEGVVAGGKGTLYQDLNNGEVFIKKTDTGNEGWNRLVSKALLDGYIQQGISNPNGEIIEGERVGVIGAPAGTLYIDTASTKLYMRMNQADEQGNTWGLLNATVEGFADTDLSNVTTINESSTKPLTKLVNTILDNKTETVISSLSDNSKFPTAKAVYNYVGTASADINALGVRVTAIENNMTTVLVNDNTKYPSSKCVYDIIGNLEDIINSL